MSKKALYPQRARHIMIYDRDWAFLEEVYGKASTSGQLGVGTAIRQLVHTFVERQRAQARLQQESQVPQARQLGGDATTEG